MKAHTTVAFVGNPNTGKSTVFNALSGSRQKVSNLPGVTVEKKSAFVKIADKKFTFVDLPGCYSLRPSSQDEKITIHYLQGKPDLIFFILDATNLKRNLYLLSQIMQLKIPVVVLMTMTDILKKRGISLDIEKLSECIGLKVIPVNGKESDSVHFVKNELAAKPIPASSPNPIMDRLRKEYLRLNPKIKKIPGTVMPQIHYQWINQILSSLEEPANTRQKGWVQKIDAFLTNRYSGLLVFVGIMYVMFQTIYTWSEPVMSLIENFFHFLSQKAQSLFLDHPVLNSLIADGILQGVGSVVVFLPQIIFLFLFIAFLEDSGYITRAVFLMDKVFAWSGLNGRSFVPMLSSFACAVPGIMSARAISDPKVRLATILVSPLMSCSARLPIYVLMIGTFIEPKYGSSWAAFTLFSMHAIGPLLSLPISKLITGNYQKTHESVFFMEMPPYRLPYLRNILYRGYHAGIKFLTKAGGVILALSLVIWALSYFPRDLSDTSETKQTYQLENSYLGSAGKTIQPIFAPLGFDWKVTIGLLSAFPAREVIISSLGILYNIEDDSDEMSLRKKLAQAKKSDGTPVHTPLTAISLMIFFALCCQCMSTLAVMYRELGGLKWPVVTFLYMTTLAYLFSLCAYQLGRFFI